MAFIGQFNQDKDDKKEEQSFTPPTISSQQAGVITANTPTVPQQQGTTSKGTSSGRFSNIVGYLKANQPGQFAQQTAQRVGGVSEEAKKSTTEAAKGFGEKAAGEQAKFTTSKQQVGGIQQAVMSGSPSVSDENIQQFQAAMQAQYTGPQELENLAKLQGQVARGQRLAQATGTEAGRFGMLKELYSRPTYTAGQQRLDQLLLGGSPEQLRQLQATRAQAGIAGETLQREEQQAEAEAARLTGEAKGLRESTESWLGGTATQTAADIEKKATELKAQQQAEYDQAVADISKITPSSNIPRYLVDKLGLTLQDVEDIRWGRLTPDDLIGQLQKGQAITAAHAITPEQQARIVALQKLAGGLATPDQSSLFKAYASMIPADKTATQARFNIGKLREIGQQRKAEREAANAKAAEERKQQWLQEQEAIRQKRLAEDEQKESEAKQAGLIGTVVGGGIGGGLLGYIGKKSGWF